jgi:hypothetical protein
MGKTMTTSGYPLRRFLTAGALAVAALAAPAVAMLSGPPAHSDLRPLADCGGIPVGLQGLGAYTTNCDLAVQPNNAIGQAPGAGAIVACRNIAGCLSGVVNGTGQVQVPNRSTAIQNSQ